MQLQTTRKENNWKTEEALARAAVTLERERMFMMIMYTVWYVDKYKITFKLIINHWTNEIL